MRFLLSTLGSYGDVHPFVGLGKTLVARGHDVSIIANPYFETVIRNAGLAHIPLGEEEDYLRLMGNPDLWHPLKGLRIILQQGMAGCARQMYETVMEHYVPKETVVAAHGMDIGSRIAQEKYGVPMASVMLTPLQFRSSERPPVMPGFIASRLPCRWPKRLQYWLADRLYIDPILNKPINVFRRELGLTQPVSRFLHRWWYSPQLVIGLFPDWFAPPQSDWPPNTLLAGFPLWDESEYGELPSDVEAFLNEGEPPTVFAPGSAMLFGHDFFRAAAEACRLTRRRGIFLTKYPEQLPDPLPEGVRHFGFVPFSQVLPRAAAFVHHGGIGSTAQGLAAGVPQIIMPRNFDQPDNGDRVKRLGVAEVLPRRRFRPLTVAATLERLIGDDDVVARCRNLATRCNGNTALAAAADALEHFGHRISDRRV